ncbi:MAG: LytTR family DNA-binding domain-containing protein, partial [Bacteroidota bacterium]
DYLLKPVNFLELQEALKKVSEELVYEQHQKELEDKINLLCTAEIDGKNIILDVENGFIMENTKTIEYCRADQSYSIVVTYTGKEILVTKSLKELQEILPENQFYRTHKSFLVNIHYIRKFSRANESFVLLKSGVKIPVSVRTSAIITKDIKKMLSI